MLERLRVPFLADQVRKNHDGLDYVSIDLYIRRLLEVLGLNYDFVITQSTVELLPDTMKTSTGKRQFLATVTAQLTLGDGNSVRSGTGADVSFDPDKAVKTAQAEAFKKAAHQFGIALELWDEDHRKDLARQRKLANATPATLKQEVWKIAKERLGKDKPTAADIAKLFGVKAGELADEATLRSILEGEGLL